MYNGVKVLMSTGTSRLRPMSNYLMLMMAANTPFPSPIPPWRAAAAGARVRGHPEDFKKASQRLSTTWTRAISTSRSSDPRRSGHGFMESI